VEYAERLAVPLRWWVQGTMLVASLGLAVLVAMPLLAAAVVTLVAATLMAAGLLGYGSARVEVRDGRFRAGRAHIPTRYVGTVEALDPEQTRRLAGVDADARAYLLLRPYLKRSVRVEVTDRADPTPYWQVCTRHPATLASALDTATGDQTTAR
jgi:hypothetical protein